MKIIKKILERIRKNKRNPYEPDLEVNLAGLVKWAIRKKKTPRQPPRF